MPFKPGQVANPQGRRAEPKPWRDALRHALSLEGPDGRKLLDVLAARVVQMAVDGDMEAVKEVANRLDGKPLQQINVADADGDAFGVGLVQELERAALRARETAARLVGGKSLVNDGESNG